VLSFRISGTSLRDLSSYYQVNFDIDFLTAETIASILLAMFRIQGFFISAPIFSSRTIPVLIKIGLSALVGFCFYDSIFSNSNQIILLDAYHMSAYILHELLIGYLFGLLVNLIFDAIATYAHLVGIQMGLSSANIFNPATQSAANPIAVLYSNMGFFFFLSFNGLYNLALIIRKSFEIIPLASFSINIASISQNFISIFSQVFFIGLKYLLPMVALMFIIDIFVAIFSKILPQANMYFLIMSNKLILGMFLLLIVVPGYILNIEDFFNNEVFDLLEKLFE
jgi:flagellar biosynthetic protein FliR